MSHKIFRLFFVLILVIGALLIQAAQQARAAGAWYVSTTGDDSNDCLGPDTPCATINSAIRKATNGDTVHVAVGTYTDTGNEVVMIDKDITLSGGWNASFSTQNGISKIDGQNARAGITITPATVSLDHFMVKNSSNYGVRSGGATLNIRNSSIENNSNAGVFVGCCGTVRIDNSTIANNSFTGVLNDQGIIILNNTSISNNMGGVTSLEGNISIHNSILAGNTPSPAGGQDCAGVLTSGGNNIIGNTTGCTISPVNGDRFNVDPRLGIFLPEQGYYPLLSGSPAIDAGNPATCQPTDQRGVARIGTCDIGAYEYTAPDSVFSLSLVSDSSQRSIINSAFSRPFQVAALDRQGSPVSGVTIDFAAPASGPSGTFADTGVNTTSASTNEGGVATTSTFTANDQPGLYTLFASAAGLASVNFYLEQVVPPANDNFASAEEIASLPFSTTVDVSAATLEPEEPQTCLPADRTVWYTFTPAATMTLVADAREGSGPKISIYRVTGAGLPNLEYVQCVSPGGAITFLVEQGQTYYIQVGAVFGEPGNVQFSLSEVIEIRGRIVDAATGAPLAGNTPPLATATLLRVCGVGCLEFVRVVAAFDDGIFRMDSFFGEELSPGTYMIEAAASGYQTRQFGPFEFTGANLDVGDLALDPLPPIGSIRGRLVDAATGTPLSPTFPSTVELLRCSDGSCFESVTTRYTDSQGEFRFETDTFGNPLPTGTYQIRVIADQYQGYETEPFDVGEGVHRDLGDLRIISFPVRLSDIQPCADLPATGGECSYSVRVWNGLNTRFKGSTWSWVSAQLPDSFLSFSNFQVKDPQKLELDKGQSRVIHFRLNVPGSDSSSPAFLCPYVVIGQGKDSLFNPVGFKDLFCIFRSAAGLSIASPQGAMPGPQADASVAATGTEAEPNNSCATAQSVGVVPPALVLDGNLDSTLEPDIDYFRFSGTPGAPVIIDYEGQPTGRGTLENPLLALFDSSCNLLALTDDSDTANSRLETTIPADGVLVLGATASPDFGLAGGGNGSYQLTVTPVPLIGSIRGRITNRSGTPLPGDVEPFAVVYLLRCNDFACAFVNSQAADSEGRFLFERDNSGTLLRTDNYQVAATANQYLEGHVETFTVGEAQDYDVGDLALESFPVVFSDLQPCSVPATGGVCDFSVRITNGLSSRLSGKAWSMVNSFEIGSFIPFSNFQAEPVRDVRLNAGRSTTLRFRFRVPGSVAEGAMICPVVYVGQNPNAFFHPQGVSVPFCVTRGEGGFTLMSQQDAQAASRQMQIREMAPPDPFPDKKK